MDRQFSQVIIIGAGPAGIACAIQLKRHGISSIIFEKDEIGGLLRNANLLENYPGFPVGITGSNFVQLLKKQVQVNELNLIYENVESVALSKDGFQLTTNIDKYNSKYLVIASGTKSILPKLPKITDNVKNKVFFDIYKLGKVKNKKIAIIGAGDCAFDYALQLHQENKVFILNRSNRIKALQILQDRVIETENVKYIKDISIKNIFNDDSKIILENDSRKNIKVDYLLIAVGRRPNLDFVENYLLDNPKVFQIGDVKNGIYRQTSIAVGDGTLMAMKINNINS